MPTHRFNWGEVLGSSRVLPLMAATPSLRRDGELVDSRSQYIVRRVVDRLAMSEAKQRTHFASLAWKDPHSVGSPALFVFGGGKHGCEAACHGLYQVLADSRAKPLETVPDPLQAHRASLECFPYSIPVGAVVKLPGLRYIGRWEWYRPSLPCHEGERT